MKPTKRSSTSLQLFQPETDAIHSIEAVERLTQVPRRTILIYYRHGLIAPAMDPSEGGYHFNDAAIRELRRIEYLRTTCGVNLAGVKMILELMNEVDRLRMELRFRRGGA